MLVIISIILIMLLFGQGSIYVVHKKQLENQEKSFQD